MAAVRKPRLDDVHVIDAVAGISAAHVAGLSFAVYERYEVVLVSLKIACSSSGGRCKPAIVKIS
jgi:hypothetical protein